MLQTIGLEEKTMQKEKNKQSKLCSINLSIVELSGHKQVVCTELSDCVLLIKNSRIFENRHQNKAIVEINCRYWFKNIAPNSDVNRVVKVS